MKRVFWVLLSLLLLAYLPSCEQKPTADVVIKTEYGDIFLKLYDDTPKHKENFIKLAKEGYYNNTTFHRVIKEFMIQGGDPNTKDSTKKNMPGMGGPDYQLDAEIRREHFHKRGALCAARQGDEVNPEHKSSGSQFYIVQGKKFRPGELDTLAQQLQMRQMGPFAEKWIKKPEHKWAYDLITNQQAMMKLQRENPDSLKRFQGSLMQLEAQMKQDYAKEEKPFAFTEEEKKAYENVGGAPFLDTGYTVFGEVVQGMEVVDKIAIVEVEPMGNRPKKDVRITVELLNK